MVTIKMAFTFMVMNVRMWFATVMRFPFLYGDSTNAGLSSLRKTAARNHLWDFLRVRSHWFLSYMMNPPQMPMARSAKGVWPKDGSHLSRKAGGKVS